MFHVEHFMSDIKIPIDFEQWIEYRGMVYKVGAAAATYAVMRLFVELAYLAKGDLEFGTISAMYLDALSKDIRPIPEESIQALKDSGLLKSDGGGSIIGNWRCSKFIDTNPEQNRSFLAPHHKGNMKSKLVRSQDRYRGMVSQMALLIPAESFKLADGADMGAEEIRRSMMLIHGCDNVLGKPERAHNGSEYPATLMRSAYALVKKFDGSQIERLLGKMIEVKGHPTVPKTTEQWLEAGESGLSRFEEVLFRNGKTS